MSDKLGHRYIALDIIRGITIAAMILVNNPGSWNHIFPPLRHASWHGCTPTDLIFPFFLLIVGASLSFSFAKYGGELNRETLLKVLKRGGLIFLTGLLLNAFPFYNSNLSTLRIFGVLQRIGLSYILGALLILWLGSSRKIVTAGLSLMVLHTLILLLFGGHSPFSLEGNIATAIDRAVVGSNHLYRGFGTPFDPEGLLGTLTGAGSLIFGYLIGERVRKSREKRELVNWLYAVGLLTLLAALIVSIAIPINKPLWSSSYLLYSAGWWSIIFALLIYIVDIKGVEKPFYPFRALGLNPLFAFVMAGVVAKLLGRVIKIGGVSGSSWIYKNCCVTLLGDNQFGSLLYALLYVALFTFMAHLLYKRRIVIKL